MMRTARDIVLIAGMVLIAGIVACHARTPVIPTATADDTAAQVVNGILVKDGVLAMRGRDTVRASMVLERSQKWLRVVAIAPTTQIVTTDTIDAVGLYVHSANSFDTTAPKIGGVALLALRAGPSAGDPAVGLIGGSPDWRPLGAAENHPPSPADPRVGCYEVERGEWTDAAAAANISRAAVPSDIRLHWQYLWHFGREHRLVATDARGAVPGSFTDIYTWLPQSPDSLRIVFSTGHEAATFSLRQDRTNLIGTVRRATDNASAPVATAPVVLQRIECPGRS